MPDEIELRAMNDHDLIVMSVMQGNETVRHLEKMNETIVKHEKRISGLELTSAASYSQNPGDGSKPKRPIQLTKIQALGIGSGLFMFASIIGGLIQGFGRSIGWW